MSEPPVDPLKAVNSDPQPLTPAEWAEAVLSTVEEH